jgi:hypothetical protein
LHFYSAIVINWLLFNDMIQLIHMMEVKIWKM